MGFQRNLEVDCLLTVVNNAHLNQYYIPYGNLLQFVEPARNEDRLEELNNRNNGKGSKLIRLLKVWNYCADKPFKSYQLERLVYQVFSDIKIHKLRSGLTTFFNQGIHLLRQGGQLDEVLLGLDRDNAIEMMIIASQNCIQNQWTRLFPTI